MPLHKQMKDCKQCGHRVEAAVMECPRCKSVFEELPDQTDTWDEANDSALSPAEILARMEQKKAEATAAGAGVVGAAGSSPSAGSGSQPAPSDAAGAGATAAGDATMSQAQSDAISKEKAEFARRWKELTGKKDDSNK